MKTKTIATVGLLATTLLASAAQAESRWPNWYIGLHGGVNFYPDSDISGAGELQSDNGYLVGASLGYVPPAETGLFSVTRWELEYTYRTNDSQSIAGVSTGGQTHAQSIMANMIFDVPTETSVTPYLGGGLGMANIEFDNTVGLTDSDDNVFAWQLMAGLSYEPTSMPMTVWGLGYRYFGTEDAQIGTSELEYSSHSVEGNVRFRF